ncbi:MAG: hypothetical protein KAU49_08420 [Candidatus Krumholzibacteria bacterium]|nr:hypothetical protein [Candidatus Krumholzibacteria bacterium]
MRRFDRVRNLFYSARKISSYNLKIVFANKFVYFLLAAFLFFLAAGAISFFSSDSNPGPHDVYYILMFPGILLIFYPTAFGIQNDVDSRMIEILFGIPDYRYKVWLSRMAVIWLIVFVLLVALTVLSSAVFVSVPVMEMVYHLMFPIFFLGALSFMFSTVVRNGNGTAVVMVIIGMGFWVATDLLSKSKWNLFLNPFQVPDQLTEAAWAGIVYQNRIMLAVGSVIAILYGLYNLQKREKFI